MYTLRTVHKSGVTTNLLIGNEFDSVMRFESYEKFKEVFKNFYSYDHVADLDETSDKVTQNCVGFIITPTQTKPIYKDLDTYIVTEGGKTFQKIWKDSNLKYEIRK